MDTYVIKRNEELLSLTQEMVDKRLAQVNERLAPIFNISLKIGSSENGRAEEYKVTLPKTSIKLSKSVRGVIKNVFGEILREELHWKYLRQKSIRRRRKKKLLL